MKYKKLLSVLFAMTCFWGCAQSNNEYRTNSAPFIETLRFMSSDDLLGRKSGLEGSEKAARYLENELIKFKIKPYFKTYRDTVSGYLPVTSNIVGYIEGNDSKLKNEFVVLGAHYDHIGVIAANSKGDSIANGANDNASGTAVLLELAKYFATNKTNKRSILVVFFSAEEEGLLGSYHLAAKLKKQNFPFKMMLNFEMLGIPMKRDFTAYLTGSEYSNMASKLNTFANDKIKFGELPGGLGKQLFKHSDNYPFYLEFNKPAHTVSSFDGENDKDYHKVSDEFGNMDLKHLGHFINEIIPAVNQLVNTEQEIRLNKI